MAGKCRPSLRGKTLDNVMYSNLSRTDKDCIKAVFERYEERPKGRWLPTYHTYYNRDGECQIADEFHCSNCGIYSRDEWNFCPNCGADMRGESE